MMSEKMQGDFDDNKQQNGTKNKNNEMTWNESEARKCWNDCFRDLHWYVVE